MPSRYWDFENRSFDVSEEELARVRAQLIPLIPSNFCTDPSFRSDGYPDSVVSCVLDSIGSVGVRYTNVIRGLEKFRAYCEETFGTVPATPAEFLSHFSDLLSTPDRLAACIWTRHRTAPRNGILKVEAMVRWMQILNRYGIHTTKDLLAAIDNTSLKDELLRVPGQSRYVSLIYFFMLAGYRDGVKDDRMIERWFSGVCGVSVTTGKKAVVLMIIADELRSLFPCMTAAELDHLIWLVESERWSPTT